MIFAPHPWSITIIFCSNQIVCCNILIFQWRRNSGNLADFAVSMVIWYELLVLRLTANHTSECRLCCMLIRSWNTFRLYIEIILNTNNGGVIPFNSMEYPFLHTKISMFDFHIGFHQRKYIKKLHQTNSVPSLLGIFRNFHHEKMNNAYISLFA